MRRLREHWPAALCASAAAATLLPALQAGFVDFDDGIAVVQNEGIRGLSPAHLRWMLTTDLLGHFQPLTWLSYAVDHAVWGLDPFGFHLTNLLLHAFNAGLLYFVALELLRALPAQETRRAALFGTLLWAVHPLRVESAAWVTERRDLLFSCFLLAATRLYLAHARGRAGAYAGSLLAFAAAMLSKFAAAPWPLALLLLDYFPLRRRALQEKLPYLAIVGLIAPLAFRAQAPAIASLSEAGLAERATQSLFAVGFTLAKSLWPSGLSPWYGAEYMDAHLGLAALGAAFFAALAGFALARRRGAAAAALVAGLFFLLMLAPASGVVKFGRQCAADRYSYVPMISVSLLAGVALSGLAHRRRGRAALGAAGVAILALGAASWRQTGHWRDSAALWNRVAAINPGSTVAAALAAQQLPDRERAYTRLAELYRADPNFPDAALMVGSAANNAGLAALERGESEKARRYLREATALIPGSDALWLNRAYAESKVGETARAKDSARRALALAPENAGARALLDALARGRRR